MGSHASKVVDLALLPLLRDDPLFQDGSAWDAGKDAFNHEAYAQAVLDLVEKNNPPLTIGLFAPWGIGKSTIVNILFKLATQSKAWKLAPIYFNAWKYSGDSFRRQFLIEVAKYVYPDGSRRDEVVRRLQQLNHSDVRKRSVAISLLKRIKEISKLKLRWRDNATVRLVLAIVVILGGGLFSLRLDTPYPAIAVATVLPFLLGKRLEDYVIIEERPIYDPKLIFPEQFEEEFSELYRRV